MSNLRKSSTIDQEGKVNQGKSGTEVEKPFQCTACDLRFTTNAARNIHAKSHKTSEIFVCKECKFRTKDFLIFRKHRLDTCVLNRHKCHKCEEKFSTTTALNMHMFKAHSSEEYQCTECDFKTHSAKGFVRHTNIKHPSDEEIDFACADCDFTCRTKDQINQHIDEKHSMENDNSDSCDDPHNEVFTCPLCDYLDPESYNIEMHMHEVHEMNKPFSCTECDFACYDDIELEFHMMSEHGQIACRLDSDYISCTLCDFMSTSNEDLEKHVFEVHLKDVGHTKVVSQLNSGNNTNTSTEYRKLKTKTVNPGNCTNTLKEERTFKTKNGINADEFFKRQGIECKCPFCGEYFVNEKGLSKHINSRHEQHECEECNITFKTVVGLKNHKDNVHGTAPRQINSRHEQHECEECHITFKTIVGLRNHKDNVHGSTPLFSCTKCDYECSSEMDLRRHISVHDPKRQFSCPECEDSYANKADLLSHMFSMNHTGGKPYSCTKCKAQFLSSVGLNIHMADHGSDTLYKEDPLEDHEHFIAEPNLCDNEIISDSDYIDNSEYVDDPECLDDTECIEDTACVDAACIDDIEYKDNLTNVDDSQLNITESIDDSESRGDTENSHSNKEENYTHRDIRKKSDIYRDHLAMKCKTKDQVEKNIVEDEGKRYKENIVHEVDGQSVEYAEEGDDVAIDGDMYKGEHENDPTEINETTTTALNQVNSKAVKYIEVKSICTINANVQQIENTKNNTKVKDVESVFIIEKNNTVPNVTSANPEIKVEQNDEMDFKEGPGRSLRSLRKIIVESPEKRKADESLEHLATKKAMKVVDDDEISMSGESTGTEKTLDIGDEMQVLYGCSECEYVGPKRGLQIHARTHSNNKRFACEKCDYACNSEQLLNTHKAKHNSEQNLFACAECDFTSTSANGIKIHGKSHNKNKYFCDQCNYKCLSIEALENHYTRKHKESNLDRNITVTRVVLKEPKERIRRKIVAIPYMAGTPKCSIQSENSPSSKEQNEETEGINISDDEYLTPVSKVVNMNTKTGKRKFVAMPTVHNIMNSENSNDSETASSGEGENTAPFASFGKSGNPKYQCKHCQYMSINRRGLSVHMKGVHGVTNEPIQYPKGTWVGTKQYACELCDYKAPTSVQISSHFRTHIGERPWSCLECGARFTHKSSLKIHEACHIEDKPYVCKYEGCSYATKLKLNLNSHYYKHKFNENKNK